MAALNDMPAEGWELLSTHRADDSWYYRPEQPPIPRGGTPVTAHIPMSRIEIILDFLYSVDPGQLERRVRRASPETGPGTGPEAPREAAVVRALADLAMEAEK